LSLENSTNRFAQSLASFNRVDRDSSFKIQFLIIVDTRDTCLHLGLQEIECADGAQIPTQRYQNQRV
jgi:hypothetical protein